MGGGRGLSGAFACIKYLMFAFNLVFWVSKVGWGLLLKFVSWTIVFQNLNSNMVNRIIEGLVCMRLTQLNIRIIVKFSDYFQTLRAFIFLTQI